MTGQVDFDEDFYLRQYPDIRKAGIDAYQHFIHHGRGEGRMGMRPVLEQLAGGVAFDRGKATILVVSHEASLTGAPILSLNLVCGLQEKYNVVSLLLGDGPLMERFRDASVRVAGPVRRRYSAEIVSDAIAQLSETYAFRFALVNSVGVLRAPPTYLLALHSARAAIDRAIGSHLATIWPSEDDYMRSLRDPESCEILCAIPSATPRSTPAMSPSSGAKAREKPTPPKASSNA